VFIGFELFKNIFPKYYISFSSSRWCCRSCYCESLWHFRQPGYCV